MGQQVNPNFRSVGTFRSWELRLPTIDSPQWKKLVALILGKNAVKYDNVEQLLMTQLVSTAESRGGEEFGYDEWDEEGGKFRFIALAQVYSSTNEANPTYFDPDDYKVALEATDPVVSRNPVHQIIQALERYDSVPDPTDRQQLIQSVLMALEKLS